MADHRSRQGERTCGVSTLRSTTDGALRTLPAVDAYPFLVSSGGSVTDVLRVATRLRRIVREHADAGRPVRV